MGKVLNWQSKLKEKNPLLKENILLIYYTIFHISCISYGNRGMFRYILQGRFIAKYVFILNFYVKTSFCDSKLTLKFFRNVHFRERSKRSKGIRNIASDKNTLIQET